MPLSKEMKLNQEIDFLEQTGCFNLIKATSLGEGKNLNTQNPLTVSK